MTVAVFTFDVLQFRAQFPFFASKIKYPDSMLQLNFDNGTNFISDTNSGFLRDDKRLFALYLMTAHLSALGTIIAGGEVPGMPTQARIDKIQVMLQPPPTKSQFQWWLSLTAWGQQLLALLSVAAAGGWSVGGLLERQGFRRIGGGFGGARTW